MIQWQRFKRQTDQWRLLMICYIIFGNAQCVWSGYYIINTAIRLTARILFATVYVFLGRTVHKINSNQFKQIPVECWTIDNELAKPKRPFSSRQQRCLLCTTYRIKNSNKNRMKIVQSEKNVIPVIFWKIMFTVLCTPETSVDNIHGTGFVGPPNNGSTILVSYPLPLKTNIFTLKI